jgi:hypothetical protein
MGTPHEIYGSCIIVVNTDLQCLMRIREALLAFEALIGLNSNKSYHPEMRQGAQEIVQMRDESILFTGFFLLDSLTRFIITAFNLLSLVTRLSALLERFCDRTDFYQTEHVNLPLNMRSAGHYTAIPVSSNSSPSSHTNSSQTVVAHAYCDTLLSVYRALGLTIFRIHLTRPALLRLICIEEIRSRGRESTSQSKKETTKERYTLIQYIWECFAVHILELVVRW